MEVNFITVSKLSSEIVDRDKLVIEHIDKPLLTDLYNKIYDKYPGLWMSGDYRIFWQYSKDLFLQINDYLTYLTALTCMLNKSIYILLNDFEELWEDNLTFLLDLDRKEEEERIERERDIYDVIIVRKQEGEEEEPEIKVTLNVSSIDNRTMRNCRTESEILCYAIRNEPPVNCYTTDLYQICKLISDMQKGYPKVKVKPRIAPDVEFEKRVSKQGKKGKKDKKGKKGKKDKGKKGKGKKK